jgi:N-acetylmuramate 1-kinase
MIFNEQRLALLKKWLGSLPPELGLNLSELVVASSDASFRRYLRLPANKMATHSLATPSSFIVMDAPPSHENCQPFVSIGSSMRQSGVNTPEIVASDLENGFLLLTDFGDVTFLSQVKDKSAQAAMPFYRSAIDSLVQLQSRYQPNLASNADSEPTIQVNTALPLYNREVLLRELMLYPDWYVEKHKGTSLSEKARAILLNGFDLIINNSLSQSRVAVHRDYHSRNLMVLGNVDQAPALGIIDFQDALHGPITYDLVSLLRDAYIEWQEADVLDWAVIYWEKAKKAGLPVSDQFGDFYKDFEWMGIQRHIKVLGIFARLAIRDGKSQYLNDIPLVMKYALAAMNRYGALHPMGRVIKDIEGISTVPAYTF